MSIVVVQDPQRLGHRSLRARVAGYGWTVWAGVLGLMVLFALFSRQLAPYDPLEQVPEERLLGPFTRGSRGLYLLGTDELGRDVLARCIEGTKLTLFIAVMATFIGGLVGCVLGMLAGYHGGWTDRVVMRMTEAQTAMPMFLVALLLLSSLGASIWNLIAVLPTYVWPTFARIVRAETMRLRGTPFIEASTALGCATSRILWRHLFPNLMGRVGVLGAISVGQVILAEAGLSFIGAGVQGDDTTWGLLISGGRKYLAVAWWPSVFPGVFVGITVFAVNGLARRFTAGEGRS
jgi:peptide/nickel transport system permease protein